MSKYCPVQKRKVVYLDCQECEDRVCEQEKHIYVLVVGSRSFTDYDRFCKIMNHMVAKYTPSQITLISGGASGADSLAEQYAKDQQINIQVFPAE